MPGRRCPSSRRSSSTTRQPEPCRAGRVDRRRARRRLDHGRPDEPSSRARRHCPGSGGRPPFRCPLLPGLSGPDEGSRRRTDPALRPVHVRGDRAVSFVRRGSKSIVRSRAAHHAGFESASQFSGETEPYFGFPPSRVTELPCSALAFARLRLAARALRALAGGFCRADSWRVPWCRRAAFPAVSRRATAGGCYSDAAATARRNSTVSASRFVASSGEVP